MMPRGASLGPRGELDVATPQREAAMFYGLSLRGHPVEELRREIDVSPKLLEKWMRARYYDRPFREDLRRVYSYRKLVLAIFDELVLNERRVNRLQ
jgi:hypothetical protein